MRKIVAVCFVVAFVSVFGAACGGVEEGNKNG